MNGYTGPARSSYILQLPVRFRYQYLFGALSLARIEWEKEGYITTVFQYCQGYCDYEHHSAGYRASVLDNTSMSREDLGITAILPIL